MISLASGLRIYLACGATDMRKGMSGLAMLVQQGLSEDPLSGAVYAFRGRRAGLIKLIWHDGIGLCMLTNYLASYYTPFGCLCGSWYPCLVASCRPVDETIPSTAVFDRKIRSNRLIEVSVIIVCVPDNDAVLCPSAKRVFMYSKKPY